MLPGGMMPIAHTIAMLRNSPPQAAIGLLLSMTPDRIAAVLRGMLPKELARLMPAMKTNHRRYVLAALSSEQIAAALLLLSADQAGRWLSELSEKDRLPIMNCMPPQAIPVLLGTMPDEDRKEVIAAMDEPQANATRSSLYEQGVAEAFRRTNVTISRPQGVPSNAFLVQIFGRSIAVPLFHFESGALTAQDLRYAQNVAIEWHAAGALAVTNAPLASDVSGYRQEARRQGWILDAVTWVDHRHDGLLQRALVSLIR